MKKEIWYSEYELRQFIDMAVRYNIESIYKTRKKSQPYSVFRHYVDNARENFELFANQLNTRLTQNENWKAIGIDLNSRLLTSLDRYLNWYNENQKEFEKFQPNCPYSLMFNVIESTKAEILKYFPEFENQTLPLRQTEKLETEQETPTFINNFDNVEPIKVYQHFKTGLVEKKYLTKQDLDEYLKAAFELKTKPKTLFKLTQTPTKQKIYTVFYVYYKDVAQKKHNRQKEYAALLGHYFEGYKTDIIRTNWARGYLPKR